MDRDICGESDAKKLKMTKVGSGNEVRQEKSSMFVKVNIVGNVIGRMINLMAYDNYQSLSRALHELFKNFFTVNYENNSKDQAEQTGNAAAIKLILVYQDGEGDKLIIGDVPWEMFIASVKRLFIIPNICKPSASSGEGAKREL